MNAKPRHATRRMETLARPDWWVPAMVLLLAASCPPAFAQTATSQPAEASVPAAGHGTAPLELAQAPAEQEPSTPVPPAATQPTVPHRPVSLPPRPSRTLPERFQKPPRPGEQPAEGRTPSLPPRPGVSFSGDHPPRPGGNVSGVNLPPHPGAASRPSPATPSAGPPEPGAEPGDVNVDAHALPEISDDELAKALEAARASTQPGAMPSPAPPTVNRPGVRPPQPVPGAPTAAPAPGAQNVNQPDTKPPGWWKLPPEERPYFFAWDKAPIEQCCKDFSEMSGLSMIGLDQLPPQDKTQTISFTSVKLMQYDEALTTLNTILAEYQLWIIHRGDYLVIRRMTEWYRHILPERMYPSLEAYRAAKLPMWELAKLILEPKAGSATVLAADATLQVPDNTARATVVPNTNKIEIQGFVYYIERMLQILDRVEEPQDPREWRLYELKYVSTADAMQLLDQMIQAEGVAQPAQRPAVTPRMSARPGPNPPSVPPPMPSPGPTDVGASPADMVEMYEQPGGNSLLIKAVPAKHKKIEEFLAKYIDLENSQAEKTEVIRLKYADPTTVAETVRAMLGQHRIVQPPAPPAQPNKPAPPPPPPQVQAVNTTAVLTPLPEQKSILVKANDREMKDVKNLIAMLDVPVEEAKFQLIRLQHASASSMSATLNTAIGGRSARSYRPGPMGGQPQTFQAIADTDNDKALVITGAPKDIEDAKALITQLDVDPEIGASEHIVMLKNSTPSAMAEILSNRFGGDNGGGGGYSGPRYGYPYGGYRGMGGSSGTRLPRFISDDPSKTLIVICHDESWPDIERLIKTFDENSNIARTTRSYRLKHASASSITSILSEALGGGRRYGGYGYGAREAGDQPSFAFDQYTNLLLVTATESDHAKAAELIEQLDQPGPADQVEFRPITLEKADAEYVAEKIEEIFGQGGRSSYSSYSYRYGGYGGYGGSGEGAPKVPVRVVAETITNRVLVSASDEDFAKAEKLAKSIDQEYAAQDYVRKTFVLEHAEAFDVEQVVRAVFPDAAGSGRRGGYYYGGSSSTPGGIKIAEVSNGIVVLAPRKKMEEIEKLIAELDTDPTAGNEINMYKIEGVGYEGTYQIAENLDQLYNAGKGGGGFRYGRGASQSKVKFIGERGSDLLFVSAPRERMAEIDQKVREYLKERAPVDMTMVVRHFEIAKAKPQDVADMIEPILQTKYQELQQKSGGGRGGWPFYGGWGGSGGPQVTVHKTARKIMVSAPEVLMAQVQELIAEFDQPPRPSTTVLVKLKTAKAADIAPIIEQQMSDSGSSSGYHSSSSYSRYRRSYYGGGYYGGYYGGYGGGSGGESADEIQITAVESSNAILLRGTEEKVYQAHELIVQLDKEARPDGPMINVYKLQYADLYEVASMIEDLVAGGGYGGYDSSSSSSSGSSGSSLSGSGSRRSRGGGSGVIVNTDYASNQLIVSAPYDKYPQIEQIIELKEQMAKTEQERPTQTADAGTGGQVLSVDKYGVRKLYKVKGSAKEIADYLDKLLYSMYGYDAPLVKPFFLANHIVISGDPKYFKEAEEWLAKLEADPPKPVMKVMVLRSPVAPSKVVAQLQQIAPARLDQGVNVIKLRGRGARDPEAAIKDREVEWWTPITAPAAATRAAAPFVPPNSLRELRDEIAALSWAQAPRITVGGVATQPATTTQPAATTRPAVATQPAAKPAPATPVPAAAKPTPAATPAASGATKPAPAVANASASPTTRPEAVQAPPTVAATPAPKPAAPAPMPTPPVRPAPVAPVTAAPKPQPTVQPPAPEPSAAAAAAPTTPSAGGALPGLSSADETMLQIHGAVAQSRETRQPQILYDEQTGDIIFIGPESELQEVTELVEIIIKELGKLDAATGADIRVFKVEHIDVTVAATILETMFGAGQQPKGKQPPKEPDKAKPGEKPGSKKPGKPGEEGEEESESARARKEAEEKAEQEKAQAAEAAAAAGQIRVFPDPRTRTLIVRAAPEQFPEIAELILKIDRPAESYIRDIRIFKLKRLNAYDVEQTIKEILGIEDSERRMRRLGGLGGMPRGASGGNLSAQAEMIERLQREVLEMQAAALASEGEDKEGKLKINPAKDITLTSNATTNTIAVMAPKEGMDLVEKLINELEQQEIPIEIKAVELQHADAEKVASELEKIFQPGRTGAGGRGPGRGDGEQVTPSRVGDVKIAADPRTNRIVIRALVSDWEKIEPIIKALDLPPESGMVQVYPVEHASATELATTLNNIFVTDPKASVQGPQAVRISADADTNTILVRAPKAQQAMIASRIEELDSRVAIRVSPRPIEMNLASASAVANALQGIFVPKAARGSKAVGQQINIIGDDTSRTVWVTAPDALFEQIKSIAQKMDVPPNQEVRIVKLEHASASEVKDQFVSMATQLLKQLKGSAAGATDLPAVVDDPRLNALIIAGSPAAMAVVEPIIKQLDVPTTGPTLATATAFSMPLGNAVSAASTINSLFSQVKYTKGRQPPYAVASGANVLYVYGTAEQIAEVKSQVVDPLNAMLEPYKTSVKDFELDIQHANVDDVATTINNWFNNRAANLSKAGISTIAPADLAVSVLPDPATKKLFISCTDANFETIKGLVAKLDVPGVTSDVQQTKIIPIKFANLSYVAQALSQAFTKRGRVPESEQITITPEYSSNSIILRAREQDMTKIEELLAKIDDPQSSGFVAPVTVPVQNVRASEVARTLTQTIQTTMRRDQRTGMYPVTVTPDDQANVLLVAAQQPSDLEKVKEMLKSLDVPPKPSERELRSYQLQYADPGSVIAAINAQFAENANRPVKDQVTVTPDYTNNALLINASADNHSKVDQIIKGLDQPVIGSLQLKPPVTIKIENVLPSQLAATLNDMIRTSMKPDRRTGRYPVTVVPEDASGTLLVTAEPKDLEMIQSLIKQLDVSRAAGDDRVTQPYFIEYADLSSVVNIINARFKRNQTLGVREQVEVIPEWATSSIVVTASPPNQEQVKTLIQQLDQTSTGKRETFTLTVQHREPEDVAEALTSIYNNAMPRSRTGRVPAVFTVPRGSRLILATCTQAELDEIKELVAQLDTSEEGGARDMRVVAVRRVAPREMGQMLTEYLRKPGRSGRADPTLLGDVNIIASDSTSAVVLTGPKDRLDDLEQLIVKVDEAAPDPTDPTKGGRQMAVFPLTNADPSSVAMVITRSFTKRGQMAEADLVDAVAERQTNSVVVTAAEAKLDQIRSMIEKLDAQSSNTPQEKLIHLTNARAEDLVNVLQQTYRGSRRGSSGPPITFAADPSTNGVVVSAGQADLEGIEAMIAQLDKPATDNMEELRIIPLKNIEANEALEVMTQYLRKPGAGRGRSTGDDLIGNIRLQASGTLNALIASGSVEQLNQVEQQVLRMDQEVEGASAPKMIKVEHTSASQLAATLSKIFTDPAKQQRGRQDPNAVPLIMADEGTNTLVIRARPMDFELIQDMARQLDTEASGLGTVKIIPVERGVDVVTLARDIENTINRGESYLQRTQPGYTPRQVAISADTRSSALIVAGPPEMFQRVEDTVKQLQSIQPAGGPQAARVIRVKNLPARDVQTMLQAIIDQQQGKNTKRR